MATLRFTGNYNKKDEKRKSIAQVRVNLSVLVFKEKDIIFFYSPALDITGYGKDEVEAKHSFEVSLDEFINYTIHKGTFQVELERLGWKCLKKKSTVKFEQPDYKELAKKNDYLDDILKNKAFTTKKTNINLPVCT